MASRRILISIFGLILFVCSQPASIAQTESYGALKFTPPRGFVQKQTDKAIIFSQVDRNRQRFCFITLYAAGTSAPSFKKGFEKEWAEKVVGPWGAAANPETETEIVRRLTLVTGGAEIYIDGTRARAYLSVVNGYGRSASLLGLYNTNSCSTIYQAFLEELDIDPKGN